MYSPYCVLLGYDCVVVYVVTSGGRACSTRGRRLYRVLLEKPEGKRLLGRPRCRWRGNIEMYYIEVGLGRWTGFIWLRIGASG
jgi:hypothetical protein